MNDDDLLIVPEVADILRRHDQTVRRLMRTGIIPGAIKIGREWRITRHDLDTYLSSLKTPTA